MATKLELTKIFLKQLGLDNSADDFTIKSRMKDWWVSPYSPIGFRLTLEGNSFLKDVLQLAHYEFKIKEDNVKSLKQFLQMNKYLTAPYYLKGQNTIIFYGETDATMIGLYGGDLAQYLENFTR